MCIKQIFKIRTKWRRWQHSVTEFKIKISIINLQLFGKTRKLKEIVFKNGFKESDSASTYYRSKMPIKYMYISASRKNKVSLFGLAKTETPKVNSKISDIMYSTPSILKNCENP